MRIHIGCSGGGEFAWDPLDSSIPNPHVLIVGTTGSGKTQLIKTIIHQLNEQGVPILVFDRHGEYKDLKLPRVSVVDFSSGVFRVNPLDPGGSAPKAVAFEVREIIAGIFKGLGDIQKSIIYEAILEAFTARGFDPDKPAPRGAQPPTMDDVDAALARIASSAPGDRAGPARGVRDRLRPIFDFKLFSGDAGVSAADMLSGGVTVVDLSSLPVKSDELAASVVVFTVRKLWNHLQSLGPTGEPRLRIALVMDEAHWYTFKGSPVERVLREGRKFGVSVILASQLMSDFSQVAIGNTALKIVLRVDDPRDRVFVSQTIGVDPRDLQKAPPFHAVVSLGGVAEKVRVTPYFEYLRGVRCRRGSANAGNMTGRGRDQASRPDQQAPEPQTTVSIDPVRDAIQGSSSIPEAVGRACRFLSPRECAALVDAFIQIALHPTSPSIPRDVLGDVSRNLEARYGDNLAEKTIARVRTITDYIHGDFRGSKSLLEELRKCKCFEKFEKFVRESVSRLSGEDALKLYISLKAVEGCKYQYTHDNDWYLKRARSILRLASRLLGSSVGIDHGEAVELAVKVGAFSILPWVTWRGYVHTCIVSHGIEDLVYSMLEEREPVRRLAESISSSIAGLIEAWDVEFIREALEAALSPAPVEDPLRLAEPAPKSSAHALARLARLKAAPPLLAGILVAGALKVKAFIESLRVIVAQAVRDLSRIYSYDVKESASEKGVTCHTITRPVAHNPVVRVCFAPGTPEPPRTKSHATTVHVTTLVNPLVACSRASESTVVLIVAPGKVTHCGDPRNPIARHLASTLAYRLSRIPLSL